MLNWRRSFKVGLASAVAAVFVLAGGYGIADAAAPSVFHGHGPHFPRPLDGTVTAVGTGNFTLAVRHHRSLIILTTSTTKYLESGSPDPVTGVTTGEHVAVFVVPRHRPLPPVTSTTISPTTTVDPVSSDTKTAAIETAATSRPPLTAAVVYIILARESGQVSTATSSTLTLGGRHGRTRTVDLSPSTTYFEGGKSVSGSTLAKGDFITAYGDVAGGVLDAVNVDIYPAHPKTTAKGVSATTRSSTTKGHTGPWSSPPSTKPWPSVTAKTTPPPPHQQLMMRTVDGVVQSVSGNNIVVRSFTGTMQTVTVTSTTTYRDGHGQTDLGAVVKGDPIRAYGTQRGATFTVSMVVIGSQPMAPQPGGRPHPQPGPAHGQPSPGGGSPTWPSPHNSNRSPHHH